MSIALLVLLLSLQPTPSEWKVLFDGKTLANWKSTDFGGQGKVEVRDGTIVLGMGSNMTGITWIGGELPRTNYEAELEAMRLSGSDFFCGFTFPVADSSCSFIVGGWGGTLVGLSSLDGADASENETSTAITFESNRWYRIRVRVEPERIRTWIDDKPVVDVDIRGRKVGIRMEVEESQPLGVATWLTSSALRNIRLRTLP